MKHHSSSRAGLLLIASLGLAGCASAAPAGVVEAEAVEGACRLVIEVTGMQ